jgi:pantetheine-phosphate adenylyltransferase
VIERASRHFDKVVVSVLENPSKAPLFTAEERADLLGSALRHLPNVSVECYRGLLADLVRSRGATVIVKGLRALSDVEHELQMAQMNAELLDGVDTMFITTDPRWSFVSSSLVKEVAGYGGDVGGLVPPEVSQALKERFSEEGSKDG